MVERYMGKEARLKAIWDIISKIDDPWLLWQTHMFAVNMTKEEKS